MKLAVVKGITVSPCLSQPNSHRKSSAMPSLKNPPVKIAGLIKGLLSDDDGLHNAIHLAGYFLEGVGMGGAALKYTVCTPEI